MKSPIRSYNSAAYECMYTMKLPKAEDVKRGISVIWDTLQCPICLDLMSTPVSTKCDHQFCKFCMMKLLDSSKRKEANCPVCNTKINKRSLQESPGFQRLVEGLQNLVQAYEQDTNTTYFTGMYQMRSHMSVTETVQKKTTRDVSEDVWETDRADDEDEGHGDLPMSCSSTVAAKEGYAKLMGLQDSCPVNLDEDSSLDAKPPASEKETKDSKASTSKTEKQNPEFEPGITKIVERAPPQTRNQENKLTPHLTDSLCYPEEVENHPVRRSLRNNKRESLSQTNIFEQRQKKSLEKVSEWLIKTSENVENAECSRDSNANSSSPSSPLEDHLINKEDSPNRKERWKCLEEQVFGAVYKRDRRGNRSFSPQNRVIADPQPPCLMKEAKILMKLPQKRLNKLTPADFVKRLRSAENDDIVMNEPPEEHTLNDMANDTTELTYNGVDLQGEKLNELSEDDVKDIPVFSVPPQKTGRKTSKKVKGKWQDIDGEFQVKGKVNLANNKQKNPCRKKGENSKGENNKAAKMPKPLVLVGVEEGESDSVAIPKSRPLGQIEVQIESYPISEDIGSPIMRKTRRSQRLQLFTEEVQGSKNIIGTSRSIKLPCPDSDCSEMQQSDVAEEDTNMENVVSVRNQNPEKAVRKNGCVLYEDIRGIDNLECSEKTSCEIIEAQEGSLVEKESIAVVPNTESLCQTDVTGSVALVSSSRSLPEAGVLLSVPDSMNPSNPIIKPSDDSRSIVPHETSASQAKCINMVEDDRNDSELDTEQLLKSFKATKRKSFHLGSPSIKRSSFLSNKENATPVKIQTSTDIETGKQQEFPNTTECLTFQSDSRNRVEYEHSSCSDFIPPSCSPNYSFQEAAQSSHRRFPKSLVTRPTQEFVKSLNHSACDTTQEVCSNRESVQSPKKMEKTPVETHHQAVDSGMLFPALDASVEALLDPTPEASKQLTVPKDRLSYTVEDNLWKCSTELESNHSKEPEMAVEPDKRCPVNSNGNIANTESSLTPDDLLPTIAQSVVIREAERVKESGEGSSHSSIPISLKQRKRRKSQKLESSSESDNSGEEELPPLVQIFRHSACPTEEESVNLLEDQAREQINSQGSRADCTWAAAKDVLQDVSPLHCPSPDSVPTSQASVDLFGTPEDGEVTAGVNGLTQESSQFSNEFITTQQKVAMQEELLRLERMMALVSEALQKKESSPVDRVTPMLPNGPVLPQPDNSTGIDLQTTTQCGKDNGKRLDARKCAPDDGGNTASSVPCPKNCKGPAPIPLRRSKREGPGGNRAGQLSRQSGRTLRSSGLRGSPSGLRGSPSGVTGHSGTTTPSSTKLEVRDIPSVIQPTSTHTSTQAPLRRSAEGKLVLVGSGLSAHEQSMVKKFAKRMGGSVTSQVTSETTHIIMSTDGDLVCERTLKYFLGIAGRKWVVSFQWISECFKQGYVLNETQFEVRGDVVNGPDHQGPMRARTTEDRRLLMKDFEICFQGPFTDMTAGQMEWMVELCGGAVVKEPRLFTGKRARQLVVVQPSSHQSPVNYRALRGEAVVIARGWLLDTVATYTLQSLDGYRT
uniref:RING-type E3 ubiquitin transferase BRCA1 n=1 Tax=Esox lucius TaxID=8010 RepID=A0A3P8XS53_ESOLU